MRPCRFLLTVLIIVSTSTLVAGIRGETYIGLLTTGADPCWHFADHNGEPALLSSSPLKRVKWKISAPTMRLGDINLATDNDGRVRFVRPEDAGTQWTFEIVERIVPRRSPDGGFRVGEEGYRFRARVAEGPFQGWYLGAEEPPEEQKTPGEKPATHRALMLVRDGKSALVMRWIAWSYRDTHK